MGTDEKGERRQGKRTGNDSGDRLVSVSGTVPNEHLPNTVTGSGKRQ